MDYRGHYEGERRGGRRDWTDRAGDEMRSWLGDDEARIRREQDERQERYRSGSRGTERGFAPYDEGTYRGGRDVRGYDRGRSSYRDDDSGGYGRDVYNGETYGSRRSEQYNPYGDDGRRGEPYGRDDSRDERYGSGAWEYYAGAPRGGYTGRYGGGFPAGAAPGSRGSQSGRGGDWSGGTSSGYGNGGRSGVWSGWNGADDAWGSPTDQWRGAAGDHRAQQSFRGKGPRDYQRSDDRIREDISDRLTDDPAIDASDITVRVQRCEVTLTGTVNNREEKRRAEDVAERISGVSEVINNLRVSRAQDEGDQGSSAGRRGAQPAAGSARTGSSKTESGTSGAAS